MTNREFNEKRMEFVQAVTGAAQDWLAYMGTDAALAAIPRTEPPRYVVAGTLAEIVKLLPGADSIRDLLATTAGEQAEPAAYLIRDRIGNLGWSQWKPCSIEEYELRKEHTDIFQFEPLFLKGAPQAAPASPEQVQVVSVPRTTLPMIYEAMSHMGDILNGMDACEDEDEEATTPAFDAIRALLDDSYGAAPSAAAPAAPEQDTALLDFLDRWIEGNKTAGHHWFTFAFDTKKSAREQIAAEMAMKTATNEGDRDA